MVVLGLSLAVFLIGSQQADGRPLGVAPQGWIVERAGEWEALFNRTSGWTGADGIYSIPISGDDSPGSSSKTDTLFVFSDTFIGEVGPDGQRPAGSTLVNNTLALLRGGDPDPDIYCYNAKAHPNLSRPGALLISYNVNSFAFLDHFASADIYRPRFINLRRAPTGDASPIGLANGLLAMVD